MLLSKLKILLGSAVVGVLVALVYFLFESAVTSSSNYVWNTLLDTETVRMLVVPLCIVLALIFFGLQQWLAPGSQDHEAHSLGGETIQPTLKNFAIILVVGFFSLLAGASLGPEAILVPSSVIIGSYLGLRLYKQKDQSAKALAAAAIMALLAAFFHSFWVGVATVLLVAKQGKTKVTPALLTIAVVASASSYYTLQLIDPTHSYFNFPAFNLKVALIDIAVAVILLAVGYLTTFALKYAHQGVTWLRSSLKLTSWWLLGLVAGLGLGLLYLLGGPLVEFTGNHSIAPMFTQAGGLGLSGLLLILIVKLGAIAWSRAMGYRGGLIFPMVFVASILVAITQIYFVNMNIGAGLIAALMGIFAAEAKAKVLL